MRRGGLLTSASADAATAPTPCAPFRDYVCVWVNAYYSGTMGTFHDNNPDWTVFGRTGGGTWNDVVSSAFNNSLTRNVALYNHVYYAGFSECISPGNLIPNFASISTGIFPWDNFNDSVSSNSWFAYGTSNPYGCKHWN